MGTPGLDGNYHRKYISDLEGALKHLKCEYLGGGLWKLPKGADIRRLHADDWLLMLPDGKEYHIWTEG